MNNTRRKQLDEAIRLIGDVKELVESLHEEEEEYRDNMPENLQGSEKYEKSDNACDSMYEAISNLEEAVSAIESAQK